MEFLATKTPVEDIFKDESWIYEDTGTARISCSYLANAVPLSTWLKEYAESEVDDIRWGHIFVVPSIFGRGVLEVDRGQMTQLASLWSLPVAAARHLLRCKSYSCYEQTIQEAVYKWYSIPVSSSRKITESLRIVSYVGKLRSKNILNTVIFCPNDLIRDLDESISRYKEIADFDLPPPLQSLQLLTFLIGVALDSWSRHLRGMSAIGALRVGVNFTATRLRITKLFVGDTHSCN